MGRLFWKILLGFWLTLLITGSAAGLLVWQHAKERIADLEILVDHPRADHNLNKVAGLLTRQGLPGLDRFMSQRERRKKHPLPMFIINEQGEDFLDRPVPKMLLKRVYQSLDRPDHAAIKQVTTPQGEELLIFIPRRNHPLMQRHGFFPSNLPVLPLLILLLGSLLFSVGLAFYITRPLQHLRDATQQFSQGQLDSRVMDKMAGRRDEIVDLAGDFDDMAEQVQQLIAGQKRLLNDVSHELRSPLARLQLAVALGRQQPEHVEAMMLRVEKESQRLDTLVGELLTLSRIEADVERHEEDYFDLNGLVALICSDAQFEADEQAKTVIFDSGPEIVINGNIELLRRATENMIRNAVFYTADHSVVTVLLNQTKTEVVLQVCDQGSGVKEEQLADLFLPFIRMEHEQNSDVPGYGLGLAIAARAIGLHKGTISALNREEGGLCITVTLPSV